MENTTAVTDCKQHQPFSIFRCHIRKHVWDIAEVIQQLITHEHHVVFVSSHGSQPAWVGSRSGHSGIRSPDWWLGCTSHPGVLGSFPQTRGTRGKQGANLCSSSGFLTDPTPDGWDQIPRWAGCWACTSHPGVLGSIPKREEPGKTGSHPVIKYRVPHGSHKVPGSSRVPQARSILPVAEEQSRTRGSQSGGVEDRQTSMSRAVA